MTNRVAVQQDTTKTADKAAPTPSVLAAAEKAAPADKAEKATAAKAEKAAAKAAKAAKAAATKAAADKAAAEKAAAAKAAADKVAAAKVAAEKAAAAKAAADKVAAEKAAAEKAAADKAAAEKAAAAKAEKAAADKAAEFGEALEEEDISQDDLSTVLKQFIKSDTGSTFIREIIETPEMSDDTKKKGTSKYELSTIMAKLTQFNVVITDKTIGIEFKDFLRMNVKGGVGGGGVLLIGGAPDNNISLTLLILGSILIPISKKKIMSIAQTKIQKELEVLNNELELDKNTNLKEKLKRIDNIIEQYYNTDTLAKELYTEGILLKMKGCYLLRRYY